MILHSDYMDKKFTHDEYYGQFVTKGIIQYIGTSIGDERIKKSTDPHFNDIPLGEWDRLHGTMIYLCGKQLKESGGFNALCDTVCVAKRAAKEIRGF